MILEYEIYNDFENHECIKLECNILDKKYILVGKTDHNKKLENKIQFLHSQDSGFSEDDYTSIFMLVSDFICVSEHYSFQLQVLRQDLKRMFFWEVDDE